MIHLRRTVAAVALLVGAAVAPGLVAAPAHAAGCAGESGTTVVVDFAELGGGVTAGCADVADGARASAALQAAGYGLTMATRSAGFVCRVNGVPASDPCVEAAPAHAYWSVWWADGDGGSWVYSAQGVASLRVSQGGYLAMAWHQGSGRSQPPATVPVSRAPKPVSTPTPKPTPKPKTEAPAPKPTETPTRKPAADPTRAPAREAASAPDGSPGASSDATAQPTAQPSTQPSATASPDAVDEVEVVPSAVPDATPSPGETVSVDPTLIPADQISAGPETVTVAGDVSDDSLPVWAPVALIAAVAAVGGVVVVRRRKAQA